jgi:putative cardiolipin synthase
MKLWSRFLVCGVLILQLASCGTSRPNTAAVPTSGFVSQETIAHACRQHTTHRKGKSGFEMLPDGREAFLARLAAVEAAQRTLDLQYFIWSDDVVGTRPRCTPLHWLLIPTSRWLFSIHFLT